MIVFWIIAALMSAAASVAILRGAASGARTTGAAEMPAGALHRRDLAEVAALAYRGLLEEDERAALRAEAARRLLAAADARPPASEPERPGDRRLVLAISALAPVLAVAAYIVVGAPAYSDQPFLKRVAAWRGGDPRALTAPQMAAVLEVIVTERPGDPEPLRALGIARMAAGEPVAAQTALRRAINLAPGRADLWAALGEAFASATEGEVGSDAQAAFREALKRDPANVPARYYLGRAALAAGDKAAAVAAWRSLESELPAADPRRGALIRDIAIAEGRAKPSGPSSAQIAAAQGQVGPEQIRAMVEGLAQRLTASPDDPEGWVRLVRAYGVIGDTAKRDAALKTARARYGARPDILKALDAAAAGAAP